MYERILIIEDEEGLRITLTDRLVKEGYSVECCADGDSGLKKATGDPFDLVLLDIGLPRKNGFDVCRDIRQAGIAVPILMLTARGQVVDKVVGLKLGADDYLVKPFESIELIARIEALLRRAKLAAPAQPIHRIGNLRVDLRGTTVVRDDQPVALSAREFQLLRYFLENRGATLSRASILREVWGYSAETFTRTVDVHVASLRHKIEPDPKRPTLITTVPGLGYRFAS